jgi:hypothetical protein
MGMEANTSAEVLSIEDFEAALSGGLLALNQAYRAILEAPDESELEAAEAHYAQVSEEIFNRPLSHHFRRYVVADNEVVS